MNLRSKPTILLSLLFFIFCGIAVAQSVQIPVMPADPVVDLAGIIDNSVETKLNRILRELERKTTAQMVVLTIPSLEGQSIEEFSIALAHDKWKLGQKDKDNGVLLVVVLNDRKYRIEVGYGLESVLPDSLVGSIGRRYLVPYFQKGDYSSGVYYATLTIADDIAKDAGVELTGMPAVKSGEKTFNPFGKFIFLLFFLVILIVFIKNPRAFLIFLLLSSMGGGRGRWGGSGGGFGGGGFGGFGGGGGGFGGGGASGSW